MSTATGPSSSANPPLLRELYFELGRALLRNNRYADAAQAFEQSLKEDGTSPDRSVVLFNLAVAYEDGNQRDRAFRNYLEVLFVAPFEMENVLPRLHTLLTTELAVAEGEGLENRWEPHGRYRGSRLASASRFKQIPGTREPVPQ